MSLILSIGMSTLSNGGDQAGFDQFDLPLGLLWRNWTDTVLVLPDKMNSVVRDKPAIALQLCCFIPVPDFRGTGSWYRCMSAVVLFPLLSVSDPWAAGLAGWEARSLRRLSTTSHCHIKEWLLFFKTGTDNCCFQESASPRHTRPGRT